MTDTQYNLHEYVKREIDGIFADSGRLYASKFSRAADAIKNTDRFSSQESKELAASYLNQKLSDYVAKNRSQPRTTAYISKLGNSVKDVNETLQYEGAGSELADVLSLADVDSRALGRKRATIEKANDGYKVTYTNNHVKNSTDCVNRFYRANPYENIEPVSTDSRVGSNNLTGSDVNEISELVGPNSFSHEGLSGRVGYSNDSTGYQHSSTDPAPVNGNTQKKRGRLRKGLSTLGKVGAGLLAFLGLSYGPMAGNVSTAQEPEPIRQAYDGPSIHNADIMNRDSNNRGSNNSKKDPTNPGFIGSVDSENKQYSNLSFVDWEKMNQHYSPALNAGFVNRDALNDINLGQYNFNEDEYKLNDSVEFSSKEQESEKSESEKSIPLHKQTNLKSKVTGLEDTIRLSEAQFTKEDQIKTDAPNSEYFRSQWFGLRIADDAFKVSLKKDFPNMNNAYILGQRADGNGYDVLKAGQDYKKDNYNAVGAAVLFENKDKDGYLAVWRSSVEIGHEKMADKGETKPAKKVQTKDDNTTKQIAQDGEKKPNAWENSQNKMRVNQRG